MEVLGIVVLVMGGYLVVVKMENKTGKAALLIAIIGFTYFGIAGMEPTHYCESREIKANCMDMSSTDKTCYTLPTKTGGKRCTEGWQDIPFTIEEVEVISYPSSAGYVCYSNGCKPK